MAAGSLKRRQSKRSNSKPPAAMASRPSHQRFLTPRNTALLISSSLVFFVVLVFGISFNVLRRSAKYEVQSPMIYSIEVVNEFPHDPRAFTQVSQFRSHLKFIYVLYRSLNFKLLYTTIKLRCQDIGSGEVFFEARIIILWLNLVEIH